MHTRKIIGMALVSIALMAQARAALAQDDRLHKIEQRLNAVERQLADDDGRDGWIKGYFLAALPILGISLFCGRLAQQTGRDFWLWALGGLVFNILALLVLWSYIEDDKKAKRASAERASKEVLDL
jgi:hypothetical protein